MKQVLSTGYQLIEIFFLIILTLTLTLILSK